MSSAKVEAGTFGLIVSTSEDWKATDTGVNASGSKDSFLYIHLLVTRGAGGVNSSVYPSGSALATASVPMFWDAPGRASTTTGCPHLVCSFSAITRTANSGWEPGVSGTMTLTTRAG